MTTHDTNSNATVSYTLAVTRNFPPRLATVALSHGVLSPTFSMDRTSYSIALNSSVTSVAVNVTMSAPNVYPGYQCTTGGQVLPFGEWSTPLT